MAASVDDSMPAKQIVQAPTPGWFDVDLQFQDEETVSVIYSDVGAVGIFALGSPARFPAYELLDTLEERYSQPPPRFSWHGVFQHSALISHILLHHSPNWEFRIKNPPGIGEALASDSARVSRLAGKVWKERFAQDE